MRMKQWFCSLHTVLLLTGLCVLSAANAAPKQLTLTYQLLQGGQAIATTQETLTVTGKQYRLESRTQGLGLYQLMGERSLVSVGLVVKQHLQPLQFESHQSKHANKMRINRFDWAKRTLIFEAKGNQTTTPLRDGTQDLLSVMYCWMWQPPKGKHISLPVTNGKKLAQRTFNVLEENAPLMTDAGSFKVVKLVDAEGEKIVYLAKDRQYLPVKLVLVDDGKRLEQVLIKVEGQ